MSLYGSETIQGNEDARERNVTLMNRLGPLGLMQQNAPDWVVERQAEPVCGSGGWRGQGQGCTCRFSS